MAMEQTVTFNLDLDVSRALSQARQLETVFYRLLGLLHKFGLPEDIEAAINKLQRLIMTIRLAHSALIAFQAASGPIGWALAIIGTIGALVSTSDLVYDTIYGR